MRGKETGYLYVVIADRITPAYAGKSREAESKRRANQDHPRICGEKTKKIP